MKRIVTAALLIGPAVAWAGGSYLSIDDTAKLIDGATMNNYGHEIEYLSNGAARYPNSAYDPKVENSQKYVNGKWFIKEAKLTKEEEQQPNAQKLNDARRAALRSVFCQTWGERTLCWDVEQLSFNPADPKCTGDKCALAKTQDYKLYREGRAETRTVVISSR